MKNFSNRFQAMISRKLAFDKSDKCFEITNENFIYTYCTAKDQSQVDGIDVGTLEETAFSFPCKFSRKNFLMSVFSVTSST